MTNAMSKRYRKPSRESSPKSVKKSTKSASKQGYTVNRFLLKLRMLEMGMETFAELNRRMGFSESYKANISHLVRGSQWRPGLARKIERFLGVKEGEIFRRIGPHPSPPPFHGGGRDVGSPPPQAGEGEKGKERRE